MGKEDPYRKDYRGRPNKDRKEKELDSKQSICSMPSVFINWGYHEAE